MISVYDLQLEISTRMLKSVYDLSFKLILFDQVLCALSSLVQHWELGGESGLLANSLRHWFS